MTITPEQLVEYTKGINERLGEFKNSLMPTLDRGIARICWEVAEGIRAKDESNADRYYRGFNDGLAFVRLGEADAVVERGAAEAIADGITDKEADKDEDEGDGEWVGDAIDPEHTAEYDQNWEWVPNKQPPQKSDEKYTDATAATLGPEHTLVTPLKPIGRNRLPDPDTARTRLAGALAEASNGGLALAYAMSQPRTLAEVDGLEDEEEPVTKQMTPARRAQLDALKLQRRLDQDAKRRHRNRGETYLPSLDELIAEVKTMAMGGVMPSHAQFNDAKPALWAPLNSHLMRFKISWEELRERAGLKPRPRDLRAT